MVPEASWRRRAGPARDRPFDLESTSSTSFARYADYEQHALVALNTANAQDGAVIEADGAVVDGFIHLLFTGNGDGIWSHPRNVIHVGRNAQVTIVETYVGSGSYFTNVVTELDAADGAVVDHYKIVRESNEAYHVGTLHIDQERSSSVRSRSVTMGGAGAQRHGRGPGRGGAKRPSTASSPFPAASTSTTTR